MTLIAFVTDRGSIQRILEHIGGPAQAPRNCPRRSRSPHGEEGFEVDAFALSQSLPQTSLSLPRADRPIIGRPSDEIVRVAKGD